MTATKPAGGKRLAYADPPYIGQARKHYAREEVDHVELLDRLKEYDGWALSASSPSLKQILAIAPPCRVGAWVKPFASFKPGVNPGYCWEPVLFVSARKRDRSEPTVRDFHSANITLKKGLSGAKPPSFCAWILDLIGWQPGDVLDDLFPGTGIMGRVVQDVSNPTRPPCETRGER